jgi:hypothetical protein
MRRILPFLALGVALASCSGEGEPAPQPSVAPSESPTASASPSATATASASASASATNGARSVAEETDDFLFEYSYPAEAGRAPELASLFDIWLAQRRESLAREAVEARRAARADGFPYNKHSYTAEWKVVADLPDWLSLSAEIATYTGGAHGNYTVDSMIWNKETERAIDGVDLFTSPAALEEALGDKFCQALNKEREKRREQPIAPDSDDPFDQCPGVEELEVLVGSSNGRTFNRLTLYAGPYVAGPYVEGAYEVELPVDRAVLEAVKPTYRDSFSVRR